MNKSQLNDDEKVFVEAFESGELQSVLLAFKIISTSRSA